MKGESPMIYCSMNLVVFFKVCFDEFFQGLHYRYAMTEMAIDSPGLPIGMVTDYHLKCCK